MDILLYAALEQRTQNQQLEELLREMVIRIKENTKEIKRLSRKQGGLKWADGKKEMKNNESIQRRKEQRR